MNAKTTSVFDLASCQLTLKRACEEAGIRPRRVEPIRLGENAIFHLRDEGLVVRITRGMDRLSDAEKELRVARWLAAEGISTAAPADVRQPVVADGRPTTFWVYVPHEPDEATLAELGAALRSLHSLQPPEELDLPNHDIFGPVASRIESARSIPSADLEFIRRRYKELQEAYAKLSFPLRACAIHGDAHVGNLLRRVGGGIVLIDLERFSFGQPEADLSTPAIERGIGWFTDDDYHSFVDSYGFDVTAWEGFPTLRAIGELKMTTWLMQNIGHSVETDREIGRRLATLRRPEMRTSWRPF